MKKTLLTISTLLISIGARAASDLEFARSLTFMKEAPAAAAPVPAAAIRATGAQSVLRDQTTEVEIALNAKTVKCSAADYRAPMLKVLVPGLAELTVLNHRNTKEGAPCIAAGQCGEALGPGSVLSAGEGTERVPVRVVLKKVAELDGDVCRVRLIESVTTSIRGIPFFHEREANVADRAAADCR